VLKIEKINHKDCNFDVLMNNPPNQEYSSRKKEKILRDLALLGVGIRN
jgi:hypothetical protein